MQCIGLNILPYSDRNTSPHAARETFMCHRAISIPTFTVMAVAADFHRDFLIIGHAFIPDNGQKLPDALRLFFCSYIIQSRFCFVNRCYRRIFAKKV